MTRHPYTLLDVFTATPLAGNGLAVVHAADGVPDATMHAFARETKLAETTFVQTATAAGATYRNRIWTVSEELPFAGHPSLGTAVAVALERGETDLTYVQQTHAGLQPVTVRRDGDRAHASVLQEPAVLGAELDPAAVMAAVGLEAADAHPALPPQHVTTGLPTVVAVLADPDRLPRARYLQPAVRALSPGRSFNLYLCALDGPGTARARMFPSLPEEEEDPATGSAAGPLLAYLHARDGREHVAVTQGVELGRPSHLDCRLEDG
ncbi:MAG: phenazine biosynthesis protein PhzF, partial [Solirubrobacterales bacterium]|nr:phenazine biosynthesis protein PhzF [Solirubrobacterales bacterium]